MNIIRKPLILEETEQAPSLQGLLYYSEGDGAGSVFTGVALLF